MTLEEIITIMRDGGISHAEFFENGQPRVLVLGPPPAGEAEDGKMEDASPSTLARHAMRLMGKEPASG